MADIPRVSVITPFLNGQEFFDEALQSIVAQTFKDYEIVLIDDGSTDGSSEKAQHYAKSYPDTIRYLHHPAKVNLGQGPSRDLGIARATGEFIAFLDIDDVWLPRKLEKQVEILDNFPSVGMTYGPYFIWHSWAIEGDGRDVCGEIAEGKYYNRVLPPPSLMAYFFETGSGLPAFCSTLIRKSVFVQLGGFEREFPGMYDDEAIFSKILLNFPIYVSSESLDKYRQHQNSFCERAIRDGLWVRDPNILTRDKGRLLRWLDTYIDRSSRCSPDEKKELKSVLQKKMRAFGIDIDEEHRMSLFRSQSSDVA